MGGTGNYSGRVEVCVNGTETYGTVCNDRWDVLEARVVCTQLGFSSEGWFMVAPIPGKCNILDAESQFISEIFNFLADDVLS